MAGDVQTSSSPTPPTLAEVWPLARIVVRTPRLEVRLPDEAELLELADLATEPVHAPDYMPFAAPWTDAAPADIRRNLLAWHWNCRVMTTPAGTRPRLMLAVFIDGRPIGCQDVIMSDFATDRSVGTASWLTRSRHGQGLGTEMREAVLHLAFDGFGAEAATSGAYFDNPASIRVSEKCGYAVVDEHEVTRTRGARAPGGASSEQVPEVRFRLERAVWQSRRRDDVLVTGIDDEVRRELGLR